MTRWLYVIVSALAALLAVRTDAQMCRADFDGSGAVEINELIAAVNEALGGCAMGGRTPTPTRRAATPTRTPTTAPPTCPFRFNQAVSADRFCSYVGEFTSTSCAPFAAVTGWTTSGTTVLAIFIDEFEFTVGVTATRTNPTTARVTSISFGPDFDDPIAATGTLSLPSNTRLGVSFAAGGTCGAFMQTAEFVRVIGSATAAVQAAPSGASAPNSAHGAQLRAMADHLLSP